MRTTDGLMSDARAIVDRAIAGMSRSVRGIGSSPPRSGRHGLVTMRNSWRLTAMAGIVGRMATVGSGILRDGRRISMRVRARGSRTRATSNLPLPALATLAIPTTETLTPTLVPPRAWTTLDTLLRPVASPVPLNPHFPIATPSTLGTGATLETLAGRTRNQRIPIILFLTPTLLPRLAAQPTTLLPIRTLVPPPLTTTCETIDPLEMCATLEICEILETFAVRILATSRSPGALLPSPTLHR